MPDGGGIPSVEDVTYLLRGGADKVAINTATMARPDLIAVGVSHFGRQCMVLSFEAKQQGIEKPEVKTKTGQEHSAQARCQ